MGRAQRPYPPCFDELSMTADKKAKALCDSFPREGEEGVYGIS